jgi:hypothetical protein
VPDYCELGTEHQCFIKGRGILDQLTDCQLMKADLPPRVNELLMRLWSEHKLGLRAAGGLPRCMAAPCSRMAETKSNTLNLLRFTSFNWLYLTTTGLCQQHTIWAICNVDWMWQDIYKYTSHDVERCVAGVTWSSLTPVCQVSSHSTTQVTTITPKNYCSSHVVSWSSGDKHAHLGNVFRSSTEK